MRRGPVAKAAGVVLGFQTVKVAHLVCVLAASSAASRTAAAALVLISCRMQSLECPSSSPILLNCYTKAIDLKQKEICFSVNLICHFVFAY